MIFLHKHLRASIKLIAVFVALQSGLALAISNEALLQEARANYDRGNELALTASAQQLQSQNYLLAPYAEYWLMLLRLSESDNATVSNFIAQYKDYPFADRVRGEWLKKLGKSQDWTTFLAEYPNFKREDVAVSCYAAQAQAAQSTTLASSEALVQAKALWLVTTDQPASCDALFNQMFNAGVLTESDAWTRLRMALAENKLSLAKNIAQRIAHIDTAKLKLIDKVALNPALALQKNIVSNNTRFGRELNIYAVDRIARKDLASAENAWSKIKGQYEGEERGYGWGRLALQAAKKHDKVSLEWFDLAKNTPLDIEQQAWKVRAALREANWPMVQSTIEAMPQSEKESTTWRYWMARALKEQNNIPAANAVFVKISQEISYYGLLAKEELGDVVTEMPSYYQSSDAELAEIAKLPAVQRAIALQDLDMRAEARQEWAMLVPNMDDKQLIAAAEVASRAQYLDTAIYLADKTKFTHNFALRYPTPHESVMKNYAKENQLDEAWVYGLIRQESRFIKVAKSKVGASGLMQVMPATAKWIAKRLGMKSYQPEMIHDLDTNVQFGTHYLRYTMEKMDGQAVMATAAYNAGPGRPKRWAASQVLEGAVYAESIPFSETRDYVKKVMANAYYYSQRLGVANQSIKQRIGLIPAYADAVTLASEAE